MKFGKVLTYKDIDEAKKLIGKRVVASDTLKDIDSNELCTMDQRDRRYCDCRLDKIKGGDSPFLLSSGYQYQFIREVLPDKPEYEPYDLSDKKVRDSLRGRWYKVEDTGETREKMVNSFLFSPHTKEWWVNGWDVEGFLKHCHWVDDGTPCGRRVDKR